MTGLGGRNSFLILLKKLLNKFGHIGKEGFFRIQTKLSYLLILKEKVQDAKQKLAYLDSDQNCGKILFYEK